MTGDWTGTTQEPNGPRLSPESRPVDHSLSPCRSPSPPSSLAGSESVEVDVTGLPRDPDVFPNDTRLRTPRDGRSGRTGVGPYLKPETGFWESCPRKGPRKTTSSVEEGSGGVPRRGTPHPPGSLGSGSTNLGWVVLCDRSSPGVVVPEDLPAEESDRDRLEDYAT